MTATDLADELWKVAKVRVDRRKIDLSDPIKKVGRYEVPVELFTDVTATVTTLWFRRAASWPPPEEQVSDTPGDTPDVQTEVSDTLPAEPTEEAAAEEIEPTQ